jgi:hypothetical protein
MPETIHTETVVLQFPTSGGATVKVFADQGNANIPYIWECSAGHRGDEAYASLPFCRNDAQAHAETCRTESTEQARTEEPRTITYPLQMGGTLTATCPSWCTADHTDDVACSIHPGDLAHQGDDVYLTFRTDSGEATVLQARIGQYPFSGDPDEAAPYVELIPEGSTASSVYFHNRLQLDDEIRRVRAHLRLLVELGDRLAEAQAENYTRHAKNAETAWQALGRTDLLSLPIAYLLKVFGVTVVETEDTSRQGLVTLSGQPGAMELRVKPDVPQHLREDETRRRLLDWYEAWVGGAHV